MTTPTSMFARLIDLTRRRLVRNAAALYAVHFANYLVPFVTIPYLARVLGGDEWGRYAFLQSFAIYMSTCIEYSFTITGTREVARYRNDSDQRSLLLSGVIGAKILVTLGCLLVAIILFALLPQFRFDPLAFGCAALWAIGLGSNFMWYFQGLEQMRLVATLDVIAKALATGSIFIFVRSENDTWIALFAYAISNFVSTLVGMWLALRTARFRVPSITESLKQLRIGWSLFASRLLINLYTVSNSFVMGLLAPVAAVGHFAGGEKLAKSAATLYNPIGLALFPRMSNLLATDPEHALHLFKRALPVMALGGALVSAMLYFGSDWMIVIVMGKGYEDAARVLRIMSILPFLLALTNLIGVQWMLGLQLDWLFTRVVVVGVVVNLVGALIAVPRWGAEGMAWTVTTAEVAILISLNIALWRVGKHPAQGVPDAVTRA